MTLKLDRDKCNRLAMACTFVAQSLEHEAQDPATSEDRREIANRSAQMWKDIHDEVRKQIDEWDVKHPQTI